MAMIEFVRNYTDHSTDRGYQFQFRCDHCSNGYMSSYDPSIVGTAGGLLQAAGSLFGGLLGNVGNSSYEIQRAIGGPAHDRALQKAVTEVKEKFRRCQRCGNWVCAGVCWNERAAQCTGCTPKYEQEVISMRTQAQIQATQEQLQEKAHGVDYVSGIDMNPDSQVRFDPTSTAPPIAAPVQRGGFLPQSMQTGAPAVPVASASGGWSDVGAGSAAVAPVSLGGAVCGACGEALHGGKFCSGCGAPTAPVPKSCGACGHVSGVEARFCEECGGRLG
ncbi:zinc ribbon domain-containing protein [Granulicella sibirica]|uniref:DZANK-type domain-containing protein n=1 Tax=Granulicella sibirica TaxID=2479048 RepID=A0A4Q0SZN9_9BACT|nr:zinc ribbon domain-containing protein [Granulicella sibirica]RXH54556.1 hypothetical protein GRAN_3660 [Granulicella sibirica]